ncbi:MAG: FliM/FliN family flagellar motor switch protein [Lysobacterales bacterium]
MSTEEILSQEEIDALLDKADSVAKKKIRDDLADEVESYDIFNPPAVKTTALPDLEPFIDRLAERLPGMLDAPLPKIFSLTPGPQPELMSYAEYRQTIESPTAMLSNEFRQPLEGLLVTVCRPGAQCLVSALFGGSGTATNRDYLSMSEARIARNMLEHAMSLMGRQNADGETQPMDFQTNPIALSGPPEETLLGIVRLNFAVGDGGGELTIAASPDTFSALMGKPTDADSCDENWHQGIADATSNAKITLNAKAAEVSLGIGDLLRIAPGDFIPVDIDQNVVLCANDQPLLRGLLGVSGAMNAVHILGPVAGSPLPQPRLEQKGQA